MDLPVTEENIRIGEPVLDAVADHPIDCDITLPDYCPDMARILKAAGTASVDSKTIENNHLTINGTFCAKVMYIPENSGSVRCVTNETPFSHNFDLKETGDNPYIKAKVHISFVNCRMISPRRLRVRGSIAVSGKVMLEKGEKFISGSEDERVEMLCKPMNACINIGSGKRAFDIHEELEVGYGKPAIASVVNTDAVAVVQDYKVISNKIIAKGEVTLKTLYTVEADDNTDSKLEIMENTIPVSQIVDIDGVDENCGCEVKFTPGPVKAEAKQNSEGENRNLEVEMTVTASARAYKTQEFHIVTDAYSPQYEMNLQAKPIAFENVTDIIKSNEIVKQALDLGEMQLSAIIDASVDSNVTNVKFDKDALEMSGDMAVSIIATDTQGSPACIEKSLPFEIREEIKNVTELMRCEPEITVVSCSYSLAGTNHIDMRVECAVEAVVYGVNNESVIVEMDLDDSQLKNNKAEKTLTLYYADKGEKVWDIAKRYNTSQESIKRENSLENDYLEDRCMLLIPKKRCSKA